MLRAGMTVALGTDGASTNDNLDLHEVMRLAIMLARPFERDRRRWPTSADALAMATVAGGKAMQEVGLGTLAPGAPADFVLHDLSAAFWTPLNDPLHQLVFGGSGSTVDTVIVGGRVLVEGRRILAFDTAPVLSEVRNLVRHLRARNHALHASVARMAAALSM
jgi:cytosine/adenosine deaminase-related metal-dependent hydrolase